MRWSRPPTRYFSKKMKTYIRKNGCECGACVACYSQDGRHFVCRILLAWPQVKKKGVCRCSLWLLFISVDLGKYQTVSHSRCCLLTDVIGQDAVDRPRPVVAEELVTRCYVTARVWSTFFCVSGCWCAQSRRHGRRLLGTSSDWKWQHRRISCSRWGDIVVVKKVWSKLAPDGPTFSPPWETSHVGEVLDGG